MRRAEPWTIADLLDFEYFLAADADVESAAAAAERDRGILTWRQPAAETERPTLFKHWLQHRRAAEPAQSLPGGHFLAGWQTLLTVAVLAGLLLGASLTAGLLHYKGGEPVNVAWFLAWTLGVQFLILVAALLVWILRKTTGLFSGFHPLRSLLAALLSMLSSGLRRLPGERRERIRAAMATLDQRREIYGRVAAWPLVIVTQLFGVFFNVGIFATLLAHVAMSDLAFGWQSTLDTSPRDAHRVVGLIARPWSSLAPEAVPALQDVIESRFSYSEGIRPLSPHAMTSWWPFLCWAVGVYGLLLRLVLLAGARWRFAAALRSVAFDHHGCNALYRRLTGPIVEAEAHDPALKIPALSGGSARTAPARAGKCIVLFASDLDFPTGEIATQIASTYGWQIAGSAVVQIDHPSGNAAALAAIEAAAHELAGVILVARARRASIKAIALFLRRVAAAAGKKPEGLLLLTGAANDGKPAEASDEDFRHWRNFLAIHGLDFTLEKWRSA